MKRPRRILLLACVLTILLWPAEKEPLYNGKKLSEWVLQLNNPLGEWGTAKETTEAGNAIKTLGTNALPWLLKWIEYEPPPSKRQAYRLLRDLHIAFPYKSLERTEARSALSIKAFQLLDPAAAQFAIPRLNHIMTNAASYGSSTRARDALAFIGEPALPCLISAATHQWRYRYELPGVFVFMRRQRSQIWPAVPVLIALLKDADPPTAESAARALGQLWRHGGGDHHIPPALVEASHDPRPNMRVQAIIALDDLGDADGVLPALINCMDDSNWDAASFSIRMLSHSQWQSHANIVVAAITKRLKPSDPIRIRTQLDALAHFGPHARSAIPAILQIMDKPASPSIWIAASNAVWRIDPQALQEKEAKK